MSETYQINAASVNLKSPEEGDEVWKVEQTRVAPDDLNPPKGATEFDWSWGPIKLEGFVDTDTYDITVAPFVTGMYLGLVNGNLKDGLALNTDLFVVKGSLNWYVKNGDELWVRVDQSVRFNGSYHEDRKITSW